MLVEITLLADPLQSLELNKQLHFFSVIHGKLPKSFNLDALKLVS